MMKNELNRKKRHLENDGNENSLKMGKLDFDVPGSYEESKPELGEGLLNGAIQFDDFLSSNSNLFQFADVKMEHVEDSPTIEIEGSSSSSSSKTYKKLPDSLNGMWMPMSFGLNNLYDIERGIPLSRQECEENIKKLDRNDRETDYYEYLEFASKVHGKNEDLEKLAVGMAVNAIMQNKMLKRLKAKGSSSGKDTDDDLIIRKQGFSVESANSGDDFVELPSRRSFQISQIITPYIASRWTSTNFDVDCKSLFRHLYQKVADQDPFFVCYAAADKSTLDYVPIGEVFYHSLANYAIRGFRQDLTETMLSKVIRMARDVLCNFLDRVRQKAKREDRTPNPKEIATMLKEKLSNSSKTYTTTPLRFDN